MFWEDAEFMVDGMRANDYKSFVGIEVTFGSWRVVILGIFVKGLRLLTWNVVERWKIMVRFIN